MDVAYCLRLKGSLKDQAKECLEKSNFMGNIANMQQWITSCSGLWGSTCEGPWALRPSSLCCRVQLLLSAGSWSKSTGNGLFPAFPSELLVWLACSKVWE